MADMDDARDIANQLKEAARKALEQIGHGDCEDLWKAVYVPGSGAFVCGCGVFAVAETEDAGTEVATRGGNLPYQAADPIASVLALIDPTEIYTPDEVERHILDVLYRLETGALFERQSVLALFAAQDAFDKAYNKAFFEAVSTSEGKRKAEAFVACESQRATLNAAKMVREAVKATMHNLRSILSGYQSTAKSVASTYVAGGSQGGVPDRAF